MTRIKVTNRPVVHIRRPAGPTVTVGTLPGTQGRPGDKGDKGDKGDTGAPGPAGEGIAMGVHRFDTPAATWTVTHGRGGKPIPTLVLDEDPDENVYTDVTYPNDQTIVVEWPEPVTGYAYV